MLVFVSAQIDKRRLLMMKKIVFLVAVGVLVSVAQTYIYNVNGKHYGKISGQIDKNTIDRYVQAAHGSVLV